MKTISLRNTVFPLLMLLGLSPAAQAAANRPAWVVNELYAWNHPYASQASGELAVKMQKMDEGGAFRLLSRHSACLFSGHDDASGIGVHHGGRPPGLD